MMMFSFPRAVKTCDPPTPSWRWRDVREATGETGEPGVGGDGVGGEPGGGTADDDALSCCFDDL